MLSEKEFYLYVEKNILKYLPEMEDQKGMVQRVKKNNQVSMMGLSIGEQKNYLLPVLYLEPFYRNHLRGQTIEETMREIASVYQGHQVGFYLDEDKVSDYEYIKKNLFYRVINYEKNKELLKYTPHERFLDLAVTYRWAAYRNHDGMASALVRNKELLMWGISKDQMMKDARENTEKIFPPVMRKIQSVLPIHIIEEEIPNAEVCVLSGPSHAEEVGRGIPTTVVVGAKNKETAEMLQDVFMNKVFRVYTSSDIIGIELGGALKNVIALAAGTVDGLGYGDNTKAALMTRGIAELTRLGEAMGGKPETFSGLTGVGDLIVTCTSVHSRNRKAGYLMGKGMTADEAMKEVKMVVEGVYSAKAALGLAKKCNVSVPIVEAVNRVLFENADPKEEVSNLLLREKKQEHTNLEWD